MNTTKPGKLILFSGPSGVGKGTVKKLFLENSDLNLVFSVSMTTRSRRNQEIEGQDYFFVSEEYFKNIINNNGFLEWANFFDNYYGTPIKYVNQLLESGKNVLLEIEVIGAKQILEKYKNNMKNIISIFLVPPSLETLEERIVKRGTESKEKIAKRIAKAKIEMEIASHYQYTVVNDNVKDAAKKITNIIKNNINI